MRGRHEGPEFLPYEVTKAIRERLDHYSFASVQHDCGADKWRFWVHVAAEVLAERESERREAVAESFDDLHMKAVRMVQDVADGADPASWRHEGCDPEDCPSAAFYAALSRFRELFGGES